MPNWLNANFGHTILTYAALALSGVTAVAVMSGCTKDPLTEALECSASLLPPTITLPMVAGIMVIKLVIGFVRDGPLGMFKQQPPVVTSVPVIEVKVVDADTGKKLGYKAKTV